PISYATRARMAYDMGHRWRVVARNGMKEVMGEMKKPPRRLGRPDAAIIAGKHRVGRVQLQCRRALVAHQGGPVVISEFLPWAFPRADSHARWMRWSVHRALPKFAVPTGRYALQGRPVGAERGLVGRDQLQHARSAW